MPEIIEELLQYLRGVWLKRRYILIATWILCPIGWLYVSTLPNQYTSSAKVFADTRSILQPLMRGLTITTDPRQELGLIVRTITTPENLEKIARASDADLNVSSPQEFDALLAEIKSGIRLKSANRENIYTVSFEGKDPKLAQQIVQGTISVFIENTLGEKRIDSDQAQRFLDEQIKEYERRLAEDEKRLADFRKENAPFIVNDQASYFRALELALDRLEQAELALQETETELQSAKAQLSGEVDIAAQSLSTIRTDYDLRIESLQINLDELMVRFTDNHPDVVETKRRLASLTEQKHKFLSGQADSGGLNGNPVLQELRASINRLTSTVAAMEVRKNKYASEVEELQGRLDHVPEIQARLTGLNRTYTITKDKYYQLLNRKESAVMSDKVDQSTESISFRVLEQPRVSSAPSGPPRLILLSGVLVVSIAVGIGLSVALSLLSPVVTNPGSLKSTGIPIFGVVSATENSGLQTWEKRKTRIFLLANASLIVLFVVFVALNINQGWHDAIFVKGLGS